MRRHLRPNVSGSRVPLQKPVALLPTEGQFVSPAIVQVVYRGVGSGDPLGCLVFQGKRRWVLLDSNQ